jgi:acetyl esterase
VLRDEGEACARKLISVGVSVTATRYLGTIGDFVMLNGLRSKLGLGAADSPRSRL